MNFEHFLNVKAGEIDAAAEQLGIYIRERAASV